MDEKRVEKKHPRNNRGKDRIKENFGSIGRGLRSRGGKSTETATGWKDHLTERANHRRAKKHYSKPGHIDSWAKI